MRKSDGATVRVEGKGKTVWEMSENGELVLALALGFFLNAAIRLIEYGAWQAEPFFIGQEPLMATHDAYAWLAGAKGVGAYAASRFSIGIRWLHEITGLPLGTIGFWLPVLTVPWLAVPACLLARTLRMTEAGVIFALTAGSSLGYLVRTRLGFCDTDLVSLFFPLAFTCAVTAWLASETSHVWWWRGMEEAKSSRQSLAYAVLSGALGAINISFYTQGGSLLLAVLGASAILTFVLGPKSGGVKAWSGLLLIYALAFGGWGGWGVGLALGGILLGRPDLLERKAAPAVVGVAAICVMIWAGLPEMVLKYLQAVATYSKLDSVEIGSNASTLQLPAIAQSVREAQNLPWGQVADRMAGNWVLFVIGLAGYVFAVFRRPQLLLFLPFLGLGLASVKLGNRFSMFGGVALGVGFGFGLAEMMRLLGQNQGRRWIAQLLLACFAFWPASAFMQDMQPVPVLPKLYAQTFVDLRDRTEPDARLWQWWDYGYAGQYYAERATFGDGGSHDGQWLYPLARVHSTSSPLQAAQLMKFVTLDQRNNASDQAPTKYYWADPIASLRAMGAQNATAFVADLAFTKQDFPADLPAQYLVVSWENLRLGGWIGYYGNWDLVSGTSNPGKIQQVKGEVRIDTATGTMVVSGNGVPVDSLDVVEQNGTRHFDWPKGAGSHAVINQLSRQVFLMDSKMYRSMMIQMLIADPRSFEPHFELVDDRFPWARVYRAR
ncbi:STT3 domain-containing protein [Desulfomicrobium escambiense]|uniref:STT3 domain-containing protein n=1 Tax=Desulfomicrobium escambiense TaxID=29503 RepID=UPI0012EB5F6E|nr:STT3 domain-containing protein [Desulfomicrobium escambiense]